MDKIKNIFKFLYSWLPLIVFIISIIIVLFKLKDCKGKPTVESNEMYKHLEDSIKTYINDKGQMVSQIELLQASKVSTLLELKSKDETIKWLQQEVKDNKDKIKNGGSVSVVGTQVSFTGSNGTIITFDASSPVKSGDTVKLYPVYTSFSKDTTWIKYHVKANKDTTIVDLSVKNKYSVVIGEVKGEKWYSKRKPVVEVTNQNPYDKVKSLRTFEVKDTRKSRLSLGLGVGVGVTPKGILPSLNVGLNYALFKL